MIINSIVAADRNRAIGKSGQIPWRLSSDLRYFKRITMGHPILMGRKSFESIGKALPGRLNIVITRDPRYTAPGCLVCTHIDEGIQQALLQGHQQLFIIGGGQIYSQTREMWDRLYLTEVDTLIEDADTFFPELDWSQWSLASKDCHEVDAKNEHPYCFTVWNRSVKK